MNKIELESKVIDFIQRQSLISAGETVVVGVSGGADSVCLLHVLAKRQKALDIKIHVAHLNHQLRGVESEDDAKYVSNLAGSLGIPITIDRQDVAVYRTERKCSIEEAARELRYGFLAGVAREVGANRIAIGHTRDDNAETILMHILRGTGTTGLCGLAPCSPLAYDRQEISLRGSSNRPAGGLGASPPILLSLPGKYSKLSVIRPLLDATREETMSYCQQHQLAPRIDSSNLSLSFFRNRLRLQLLPLLRQYNPSIEQALLRLADIAKEDSAFIEQQASGLWHEVARQENNRIYLDKKQIANLSVALQRQLLRTALAKLVGDTRDIEANHIEAIRNLLNKPVGKMLSLPHGLICHREYDELVITLTAKQYQLPSSCPFPPLQGEFPLNVPGETVVPGWRVRASIVQAQMNERYSESSAPCHSEQSEESNSAQDKLREESTGAQGRHTEAISADFDLHKAGTELLVRQRRSGDRFQPLGMNMTKELQEFMIDAKIPRSWRARIPIVSSPRQIIWVAGWRIDDRVKITEVSKEILHLEFIKSQ